MKTKLILPIVLLLFMGSCITPDYLPSTSTIDINEHGSYIKLTNKTKPNFNGELIAIDTTLLIVLNEETGKCDTAFISEIEYFKLRYAKPKHYAWTIPVFSLLTITHGFYALYSMPVNLIVTISVTVSGEKAFQYSEDDMTYEKLKMFARFPQGIPPNVNLDTLK
ncbi:MAG: hypothetical protein EP332_06885 [Bacteroidetes bacterium]|nr:MAG: hypothetical protein EP332_06885 [Bacteroidota bacterium]